MLWVLAIVSAVFLEVSRIFFQTLPPVVSWVVVISSLVFLVLAAVFKKFPLWGAALFLAFAVFTMLLPFWLQTMILWVIFWIVVGILGLFILIQPLRVGVMARYDAEGFAAFARVGPVQIKVFPMKKGPKKEKKPKEAPPPEVPEETAVSEGGSAEKLQAALSIIGPIWEQVRRKLLFNEITLHYTAATDDAAQTAIRYGAASAAVSKMMPMICGNFRVKKQDVQIRADFVSGEDKVFLRVRLSISIFGALCLGLFTLIKLKQSGLIMKGANKHGQASHQPV
ncbi:MAG: DUF2953 domain-containing protein [Oscillospiraceae bacterium]|nr:DUF2953 domain-containing protein [Oscillospiraceae bacterium]